MKVLVLGNGLLGNELSKQAKWDIFSRKQNGFDVINVDLKEYESNFLNYDVLVNCIAHTKTYSKEREIHMNVNCLFVDKLIDFCNQHNKKLVHISTDYIYAGSDSEATEEDIPVHLKTWYGYSKLVGDALVQLRSKNYLICRLSHKPKPFPYETAWFDIKTNGDFVDVIASKVIDLINGNWSGVYNVGTEVKSIYDMVKKNKEIEPSFRPTEVPYDTTMNINKLNSLYGKC